MADYGKYDVIRNPDSYVVVNTETHEWVTEPTRDRSKAHRQAQELQERDAKYPAPPADPKPGEYEPGTVPADAP